jgi:GNAT superfamily N-acetyltransferase
MELRPLREGDDRSRFRCGDLDLDRFFTKFAGQNQFKHYIGTTYVAVESSSILAFATVAPGHLEVDGLPAAERKKLPHHPLPILRLARLAVDQSTQRQGLGAVMLRFVLRLALRMADDYGCTGVVVDAKIESVPFYRGHGFTEIEVVEGASDVRPQPVAMFVSMRALKAAARA